LVAAAAVVAALVLAGPAQATPVTQDLTVWDLNLAFDGTSLTSSNPWGNVFSWLTPTPGGVDVGTFSMTWNGSSGNLTLLDSALNTLLSGTIWKLTSNVFTPNAGATFVALVNLSTSSFGLGNAVQVSIGSTDFAQGFGTGQADITSVPEPATISFAILGLGGAVAALRRRRTVVR
jgi:uncharacterized protein (TIGR03382 family)